MSEEKQKLVQLYNEVAGLTLKRVEQRKSDGYLDSEDCEMVRVTKELFETISDYE